MAEKPGIETKLVGSKVVDPHGNKVGTISALFVHGDALAEVRYAGHSLTK